MSVRNHLGENFIEIWLVNIYDHEHLHAGIFVYKGIIVYYKGPCIVGVTRALTMSQQTNFQTDNDQQDYGQSDSGILIYKVHIIMTTEDHLYVLMMHPVLRMYCSQTTTGN